MTQLFDTGLEGDRFLPREARAALVIVHGLGEHRGRYRTVANDLAASGIVCFTYDQRGHGESPGARAHIDSFSDFTDDLSGIVAGARATFPSLPLFLWGHSLGSIVALRYVLRNPDGIRGGITTGCPFAALPPAAHALGWAGAKLCNLLPKIWVRSRLDPVLLSQDERIQQAYRDDPLVTQKVTLELVFELSLAIERIEKQAHRLHTPWLAVHGAEDRIAPVEGSKRLIDAIGSQDKRLVIIEAARHEVQNEKKPLRDQFLELVSGWITERAAW